MFAGNEIYTGLNKYISIPHSNGESIVETLKARVFRVSFVGGQTRNERDNSE